MSQMSQLLTDSDSHELQLVTGFFYEHEFTITQDVIGTYVYIYTYIYVEKFACSQQLQRNHRLREAIDIAYKKCEGKFKAETIAMLDCGICCRKYLNGIKQDVQVAERI